MGPRAPTKKKKMGPIRAPMGPAPTVEDGDYPLGPWPQVPIYLFEYIGTASLGIGDSLY